MTFSSVILQPRKNTEKFPLWCLRVLLCHGDVDAKRTGTHHELGNAQWLNFNDVLCVLRVFALKNGLTGGLDNAAAQADFAVVEHHRLPRRHRALRFPELDDAAIVGCRAEEAGLIGLAVANTRGAGKRQ
jgi:hypothetical protein